MSKYCHTNVQDKGLEWLETFVERQVMTSGSPASYAEVAGMTLAAIAIDETDLTIAPGDVSGRKVTIAAQLAVDVTGTGTGDHICLVDDTDDFLMFVTQMTTPKSVESGDKVDMPAWDIELRDPL